MSQLNLTLLLANDEIERRDRGNNKQNRGKWGGRGIGDGIKNDCKWELRKQREREEKEDRGRGRNAGKNKRRIIIEKERGKEKYEEGERGRQEE